MTYYADLSDPEKNYQFRRLRQEPLRTLPLHCRLDREADAELAQGHHAAAERLSRAAQELRVIRSLEAVR